MDVYNAKVAEKEDGIDMDPAIAKVFYQSKAVSSKSSSIKN